MLDKSRQALDRKYHPKNFNDLEFDLVIVIHELSGGIALYVLQKSPFVFLTRATLIGRRQDFKLRIRVTVGSVKMSDIMANNKTFFKDIKPGHKKVGMTLMMDEVGCDGQPYYLADTDEIAGLCEHAGTIIAEKDLQEIKLSLLHSLQEDENTIKNSSLWKGS